MDCGAIKDGNKTYTVEIAEIAVLNGKTEIAVVFFQK